MNLVQCFRTAIFRLTSPLLLIAVAASLAACNFLSKRNVEKKIIIAGQELSLAQQYGLVSLCSFPLFYLAGAGAIVFWVLGKAIIKKVMLEIFILKFVFYTGKIFFLWPYSV